MIENIREKILNLIDEEHYKPLKVKELSMIFGVNSLEIDDFYKLIDDLDKEGEIYITKKKKVARPEQFGKIVGKFSSKKGGYGFVIPNDSSKEEIFIGFDNLNSAMNNDIVLVDIILPKMMDKKAEGNIIKIVERARDTIVGTFEESEGFAFVVPDDKKIREDIFVPKKYFSGAKNNDKVICKITKWPEKLRSAEGKIIEVIGKKGKKEVEITSIIKSHDLPEKFPEKVIEQAIMASNEPIDDEIKRRVDLRDKNIFTIDGDDAKDLDDAVCVEVLSNGNYRLGVHIADVTHYVRENTKLDKDALKRATSVYLVDTVIPMLPKELSNGACSLNANEDKLALSVSMEIDNQGNVVKHDIFESVINSKARMTYTDVSDILENDDEVLKEKYNFLVEDFKNAEKLAKILMAKRKKRGSIDFNIPEPKIILDKDGGVLDIKEYERRISNRLIEEFMLVTNETVAEHFFWMNMPFVYRIHENPELEKMTNLNNYLSAFGYLIKGSLEEVHPKSLQKIIEEIQGKKEESSIAKVMLRSFKHALYSPECKGHFGLAAKYYCHFTSPIRRYPDLQIHRIIKESINGQLSQNRIAKLKEIVEYTSVQSSEREKLAETVEREVDDYYKAVYMSDKVGYEFDGVISSVTSFGIFIELENTVEGLIRLVDLDDDYYIFDEKNYRLIGENTNKIYSLGDEV
ncbi:MAG: ribonuclease R, partial [Clostridioides sp.]|nr:ribonuclease R [Clostridioides sp.]